MAGLPRASNVVRIKERLAVQIDDISSNGMENKHCDMPDFGAQRWSDAVVSPFQILIERNALHKWIANAFLAHPPDLVPMTVFRQERRSKITFATSCRFFQRMNAKHSGPAITHTLSVAIGRQRCPGGMGSPDLLRVARLAGHFGMLGWAANQIQDLLRQPITWTDLKRLYLVPLCSSRIC